MEVRSQRVLGMSECGFGFKLQLQEDHLKLHGLAEGKGANLGPVVRTTGQG